MKGIDTARNASEQLGIHLINALNHMLEKQHDDTVYPDIPIHSYELDLQQLHAAIKKTYYDLDQDLRKVVKDESGCVCVRLLSRKICTWKILVFSCRLHV